MTPLPLTGVLTAPQAAFCRDFGASRSGTMLPIRSVSHGPAARCASAWTAAWTTAKLEVPLAPTHDPGYQRVIGRRMNWRLSLLCSQ
jgi:hypothetical protein